MMSHDRPTPTPEQTEALNLWAQKVGALSAQIAQLLSLDVLAYLPRTARQAFIEHPGMESLTDEEVQALKTALQEKTEQLAQAVRVQIEQQNWLQAARIAPESDLEAFEPWYAATRALIGAEAQAFFAQHGLGEPSLWQPPRRFIGGQDLVSLSRSLAKALRYYHDAHNQLDRQQASTLAEQRARRWDDN